MGGCCYADRGGWRSGHERLMKAEKVPMNEAQRCWGVGHSRESPILPADNHVSNHPVP